MKTALIALQSFCKPMAAGLLVIGAVYLASWLLSKLFLG